MSDSSDEANPEDTENSDDQEKAEAAFVESLIACGQAAKCGPDGKLPPGATHEIIEDETGKVSVVRRRFSAY